jgi:hypothetical protein
VVTAVARCNAPYRRCVPMPGACSRRTIFGWLAAVSLTAGARVTRSGQQVLACLSGGA